MLGVSKVVFVALHNTAYRVLLLMSEVSKVYCTLYTVASHPARREGYLLQLQYLKSLLSLGFSSSPPVSLKRQLC